MKKEFFYDLLIAKQIIPAKMVDAMQVQRKFGLVPLRFKCRDDMQREIETVCEFERESTCARSEAALSRVGPAEEDAGKSVAFHTLQVGV